MLLSLKINNIALISESEINFSNGFNTLTGETGAGKSLIIDSLNFVLGARADKSLIKHGQNFAKVEAVFLIDHITDGVKEFFESIGEESENKIIISRLINLDGKNDVRVNGSSVTNSMLKRLTSQLVDIHGQHSHQSLLETKNHITILDNFNKNDISKIKLKLHGELVKLKSINNEIKELGGVGEEKQRNIDYYTYQLNEIEEANLKESEDETLKEEKNKLLSFEKLSTSLNSALNVLSNNEENSLLQIKRAINYLSSVSDYDDIISKSKEKINTIYYDLMDSSEGLSDYATSLEFDENRLNQIEERLDLINSLKRKYGNTINDILQYKDNVSEKLDNLINSEIKLKKLVEDKHNVLYNIFVIASELREKRMEISRQVEVKIVQQLSDLGMKNAQFKVEFLNEFDINDIESKISQNGADDIEFMFSANLGEPVKSLSKIISGGEMSRFMLAIKCVLNDEIGKTLIFDEIDNGIGGIVGQIVAQKLYDISKNNQVICVTHLAQIASYSDEHFKIYKFEDNNSTISKIVPLNDNERVSELSRLLGSDINSSVGRQHSIEMLVSANKYKLNS